jgi:4-cresol dehydrogenase (hydroxylating) flavoprotein subunit
MVVGVKPQTRDLTTALAGWRASLGEQRVLAGAAAQEKYGTCTTGLHREVPAALQPTSLQDILKVLAIARQHGVPLYPISTGHNWGYGTALPQADGCAVLDLSGLNRIVNMDPLLGVVTVEPGVTQQMLFEHLERERLPFLVPTTGAGPNCSLVGNALERGYGITPYADHFGAVTAIEAILPDGRTYRSGLAELGGEVVDRAFKWGHGPYIDGLFAQGSFGIVTRMTIALAPRPERIAAFLFAIREEEGLEAAVAGVQQVLRRLGGVVGSINLMNARRVLAMMAPYPASLTGPDGILPDEVITTLARENRVAAWTGFGALYGTAEVVKAAQRAVHAVLKSATSRLNFVTPSTASRLSRVVNRIPWLRDGGLARKVRTLDASLQLVAGKPSRVALPLAYLKSLERPSLTAKLDPARDGCGLIWYPPLVPMMPERVRRYAAMVERICTAHGVEPLITLTSLSDRCFDSSIPLVFDRSDPRAVERAQNCYLTLLAAGKEEGFIPYRLGVLGMDQLTSSDAIFWDVASKLKFALDPDGIIAPGRYSRITHP